MSQNYLEIESAPGVEGLVKQDLKFKTGNFIWRVRFNTALDPRTVNNQNLNVTSANATPISTKISYDSAKNEIEIEPLEPYAKNETYILNVSKRVKSKGGKPLKKDISIHFKL